MRENCKSETDRSRRCYRCGVEGHKAQGCSAPPKCPVCADLGRPVNHHAGNKTCSSAYTQRRRTASRTRGGSTQVRDVNTQTQVTTMTNKINKASTSMEIEIDTARETDTRMRDNTSMTTGTSMTTDTSMKMDTSMKTDTRMEKAKEEEEMDLSPKPQCVRPLPKVKGVELVEMSVERLPDFQDQRDREQRATKTLRFIRRITKRRDSLTEEEGEKIDKREPEDSRHEEGSECPPK